VNNDGLNFGGNNVAKNTAEIDFSAQKIQLEIANWTSREPYDKLAEIESKISGRLLRKYKIKVETEELNEKIVNYKQIYDFVKKNLPRYLLTSKSGLAEPQNVKNRELKDLLTKSFPRLNAEILEKIMGWVIEYEYLR